MGRKYRFILAHALRRSACWSSPSVLGSDTSRLRHKCRLSSCAGEAIFKSMSESNSGWNANIRVCAKDGEPDMFDRTVLECDTVRCLRRRSGVDSRGVFSVAVSSSEISSPEGPCRMRWGGLVLVDTSQSATESDGTRAPGLRLLLGRWGLDVYGGGGSFGSCSVSDKTRGEAGEAGSAIV